MSCKKCEVKNKNLDMMIYKETIINLAKEHKKNCKTSNCRVSLYQLMTKAQTLGVKFTDKELSIFI